MRPFEQFKKDAAQAGLASHLSHQQTMGREYKPDKHFKITPAEFIAYHDKMTIIATGWYVFNNVPVWVEAA